MKSHQGMQGRNIYLKHCPRCAGDLSTGNDHYGRYIHCLQCGYMADIEYSNQREVISVFVGKGKVA